jgi:apolipoprotein D and lipocalin family protein
LKGGREEISEGWGRAADVSGSKLHVTFFRPFSADYWIIGLDENYQWAVVGSPSRRYLWILSRTPTLSAEDYACAERVAAAQGFDTTKLVKTPPQT